MKDYFNSITCVRAEYNEREDIEWSNFWIDQANKKGDNRILLIGDSTARMVRSTLAKLTGRPVDLFASSSSLHDTLFVNQVKCFFSDPLYKYATIFVQLGHHAEIGIGGGTYSDIDWEIFENDFREFCKYLLQFTDQIIIESIFYTVIPSKRCRFFKKLLGIPEIFDEKTNKMKDRKTEIEFQIAKELGLQTLDINGYMLNEGKKFRHGDHIHFEESAKPFICKKMIDAMLVEGYDGKRG